MPARLEVQNFPTINVKEKTRFNADALVGDTLVTPESVEGLVNNDFVYLGNLGAEQCEKKKITTVGATTLTVTALVYAHKRFEDITAVYGDQIQLYRAPNVDGSVPGDGSFATLGTPVDIEADAFTTQLTDINGGSDYWYKYVYWNSFTNAAVTYLSDISAARGGNVGKYATVQDVRNEAGFRNNKYISDSTIAGFITTAASMLDTQLFGRYTVPFQEPVPDIIRNMTKVLAAGLLLQSEYGNMASGTDKEGLAKIEWVIGNGTPQMPGMLSQIMKTDYELFDNKGNSLRIDHRIGGHPDDNSFQDPELNQDGSPAAGGGPLFRVKHVF